MFASINRPDSRDGAVNMGRHIMRAKRLLAAAVLATTLLAVPVSAKKIEVTMADIGLKPVNVMGALQAAAQGYLKDPGSAQFQIINMYPGYCKGGWLRGGGIAWKGWAVNIMINGRNGFGGYTGYTPYTAMFNGDTVFRIEEGHNFGAYGPSKGLLGGGAGVCQFVKE